MSKYSDYQQKELEKKLQSYCDVCVFVEDHSTEKNGKYISNKVENNCSKIHPIKLKISKNKKVVVEDYSESFMPVCIWYYESGIVSFRSWFGKDRGNFPTSIGYYPSSNIKEVYWNNVKTGIVMIHFFDRPKHNIQAIQYAINGIYVSKESFKKYQLIKELSGIK